MPGNLKSKRFLIPTIIGTGVAAYALFLRKRMLNWGATVTEVCRSLPGDDLVPAPNYQTTHAALIHTTPQDIWPWIIQLGYRRGGFYSYDWLERQAGLTGLHSADRVMPDWQEIHSGDTISISPVTPMEVSILAPERALVLHIIMNPFTAQVVDRDRQPDSPYMDWSWAFLLEPVNPTTTRFLIRVRADFQPQPMGRILSWLLIEPVHFIMESKMMRGIQIRAEANRS